MAGVHFKIALMQIVRTLRPRFEPAQEMIAVAIEVTEQRLFHLSGTVVAVVAVNNIRTCLEGVRSRCYDPI